VREFRVNQSCTILRRPAFGATGAPANQLMQLMFQNSARNWKSACRWSKSALAITPSVWS